MHGWNITKMRQPIRTRVFLLATLAFRLAAGCLCGLSSSRPAAKSPIVGLDEYLTSQTPSADLDDNKRAAATMANSSEPQDAKQLGATLAQISPPDGGQRCSSSNIDKLDVLCTLWQDARRSHSLKRIGALLADYVAPLNDCFQNYTEQWLDHEDATWKRYGLSLQTFDDLNARHARGCKQYFMPEIQNLNGALELSRKRSKWAKKFHSRELESLVLEARSTGAGEPTGAPNGDSRELRALVHKYLLIPCSKFRQEEPVIRIIEPLVKLASMTGANCEYGAYNAYALDAFNWAARLVSCKQLERQTLEQRGDCGSKFRAQISLTCI